MTRFFVASSTLLFWLMTLVGAPAAHAQGVVVYGPLQPQYEVGGFRYRPPMKDGWRQVTRDLSTMRLVYVESLGEAQLHTRADVVAEAFPIPDPALVTSGLHLTSSGLTQQMEQRGDLLMGYTRIQELDADLETHAYTLSIKLDDLKKRYETFFVVLSPDKTEYLVAKLTIDEEDYNTQPFFSDLYESIRQITFARPAGAETEPDAEATGATEGEGNSVRESAQSEQAVSAP